MKNRTFILLAANLVLVFYIFLNIQEEELEHISFESHIIESVSELELLKHNLPGERKSYSFKKNALNELHLDTPINWPANPLVISNFLTSISHLDAKFLIFTSELPKRGEILTDYGFDENSVYLSPAPLYHAAPFSFTNRTQVLGGTVVMMPRFDAEESLRLIEKYKVTHSQWVPTMFIRMLKLKKDEQTAYDLSTHQVAIHAAAPCPVEVKRQMIDWWGPILQEYYAASERNGSTRITSEEWLQKPGSVGKAVSGIVRVCDDDGKELGPGEDGIVYFERETVVFTYHNDPERTKEAQHPKYPNWSTMGDVGYLDEDGYLFLTDRKTFMIISGGVNIYPQMIEDALCLHPKVADVAVIGVPNPDFGEEVKAIIQTADGVPHDEATREELMDFSRDRLASYMVPRSIDFRDELPRLPTGKLYKKQLRTEFWP